MRTIRLAVVAAATALALVALGATGALAAGSSAGDAEPRKLMISTDGDEWSTHLDAALFGDDLALVPGSTTSSVFWVKNLSDGPASLTARLIDVVTSSSAFARHLTVSASTPSSDAQRTATPSSVALAGGAPTAGGCTALLAPLVLAAGDEAPITVDLALAADAAAGTAGQTLDFTVLVTLTGLAADQTVPTACDPADPTGESTAGSDASVRIDGLAPSATSGGASRPAGSGRVVDGSAAAAGSGASAPGGTAGELPVHALGTDDSFVAVALRDNWLPLLLGVIAVAGGAFVAVTRRRADEEVDR